jgi:DUF4097 and DUF4098 domain-containing protein YvlB
MKKQNNKYKIVFITIGLTFFFFGLAAFSFDKAKNGDPAIASKIENKIKRRYNLGDFHINFSDNFDSNDYVKSTMSSSYSAKIKFLDINTISADIKIIASVGDDIIVTANGQLKKENEGRSQLLDIISDENEVSVSELGVNEAKSIQIQVFIPKNYKKRLKIKTVSGDITIGAIESETELYTVSGDIKIESNSNSSLAIGTVSGDVEVIFKKNTNDLRFELETVSGTIQNKVKSESNGNQLIKIHTISGDIELQ